MTKPTPEHTEFGIQPTNSGWPERFTVNNTKCPLCGMKVGIGDHVHPAGPRIDGRTPWGDEA